MPTGTVMSFSTSKGFGRIVSDEDDAEVFVHRDNLPGKGNRSLEVGQWVKFDVIDTEKGRQARKVKLLISEGTVKWFNKEKGFGFLTMDGASDDVFVHQSQVMFGVRLEEGQRVKFCVGTNEKGPLAIKVSVLPVEESPKYEGTVKWFNDQKGYGFIERQGLPDLFVHVSANDGQPLQVGQQVKFQIGHNDNGQQAVNVCVS